MNESIPSSKRSRPLRPTHGRALHVAAMLGVAWLSHALPAHAQDLTNGPTLIEIDGTQYQVPVLHPTGVLQDSAELIAAKKLPGKRKPPIITLSALPTQVDLASELPPPGDQGWQGSCVGWAVGYATKTFHEVTEEGWRPSSTDTQFSPSWVYNQINGGSDGGSFPADAMDLMVNVGADSLTNFPYDPSDYTTQPDAASFARAAHYRADSWNTLEVDVSEFKSVLAGGNPIVIAMAVLPDFDALNGTTNTVYDTAAGTRSGCPQAPCVRGYHAIALIGYDDALGAFKFINSWGTGFNLGGYGWIAYPFISDEDLSMAAYVLHDADNLPFSTDEQVVTPNAPTVWLQSQAALR